MNEKVIYVGVDVDDKSFHATALLPDTGEVIEYKSKPTLKGLQLKLEELKSKFPRYSIKICYEATYIGFTLQSSSRRKSFQVHRVV